MGHLNKDILVVIPARKGSKRLPGKNSMPLAGKPLIAHSIDYAQKHIANADIVVSTNDPAIVAIAEEYKVNVLHRSEALCQDHTPTSDVLQNVLEMLDVSYRYVVLLQPTNPLRPTGLFKKSFDHLLKHGADSLLSVSPNKRKLGTIDNHFFTPSSYHFGQRIQDLTPLFFENGLMYISAYDLALKGSILSETPLSFEMDHPFATVDIDTELDFQWAEFVLNNYND